MSFTIETKHISLLENKPGIASLLTELEISLRTFEGMNSEDFKKNVEKKYIWKREMLTKKLEQHFESGDQKEEEKQRAVNENFETRFNDFNHVIDNLEFEIPMVVKTEPNSVSATNVTKNIKYKRFIIPAVLVLLGLCAVWFAFNTIGNLREKNIKDYADSKKQAADSARYASDSIYSIKLSKARDSINAINNKKEKNFLTEKEKYKNDSVQLLKLNQRRVAELEAEKEEVEENSHTEIQKLNGTIANNNETIKSNTTTIDNNNKKIAQLIKDTVRLSDQLEVLKVKYDNLKSQLESKNSTSQNREEVDTTHISDTTKKSPSPSNKGKKGRQSKKNK